MPIEAPELVRAAMTATGTATPTQLARALRMPSYSAPRNISRWLESVSKPDYDSTLLLLQAAGYLTIPAARPAAAEAAGEARAEAAAAERRAARAARPRRERESG
jgi:hypothetical protein